MSILHDPDGLALLIVAAVLGLALTLLALCIEYVKAAPLRRQHRRTAALQRYCNMIDRDARSLLRAIDEAGEA